MLSPRRLLVAPCEFVAQGTVAGAADALSFTPSAVSQQLAQLQREAGVDLFRRSGRRLELTDAGRMLAERAGGVLGELEALEAGLASLAGEVRGLVRLASFQTATRALVMPALPRLATAHPDLRVELIELEAEESLPVLARGGVDIAIAEEYEHAPRPHCGSSSTATAASSRRAGADAPGRTCRGRRRTRRCGSARCAGRRGRPHGRGRTTRTCSSARAGSRAASSRRSTTASTTFRCSSTSWRSRASRRCSRRWPPGGRSARGGPAAGRGPISRALFVATRAATGAPVDRSGGRRDPRGSISPSATPGSIDAWTFVMTGGPSARSPRGGETSPARAVGALAGPLPAAPEYAALRRTPRIARSARWSRRR